MNYELNYAKHAKFITHHSDKAGIKNGNIQPVVLRISNLVLKLIISVCQQVQHRHSYRHSIFHLL